MVTPGTTQKEANVYGLVGTIKICKVFTGLIAVISKLTIKYLRRKFVMLEPIIQQLQPANQILSFLNGVMDHYCDTKGSLSL